MSDELIAETAAAQVQIILLSLERPPSPAGSGGTDRSRELRELRGTASRSGTSWLPEWKAAAGSLRRLGRGSPAQCATLVWRQIDLTAALSGQTWWSSPGLRHAAVGEIAWTTAIGRWGGSVPSAAAQQQWDDNDALTDTILRRLATTTFGRRVARRERLDALDRVGRLRGQWEDAWWAWATARALDDAVRPARVGVRLA